MIRKSSNKRDVIWFRTAMVQWNHAHCGAQVISKCTGPNPSHDPRVKGFHSGYRFPNGCGLNGVARVGSAGGGRRGTLADLLAALQAGPAHLTLRLLSSSEGVHLSCGVQEPDPALHAPSEAPFCPSPPPGAVSWALGGELHCPRPARGVVSKALGRALSCSSDALAGTGTGPGAGSTGPLLEDKPLEDVSVMDVPQEDMPLGAEGEAPFSGLDTAFPAAPATEAQVPPGFREAWCH
ncbi:hypothetical protein E2C01_021699 [Portunus trituberculatus]|uniref:Uncharacterized protein n=1 Tax=Portunus trituberculatus TaxID=210409 RepID=A0A5B7E6U9_PORTR|nr:hypothetical protein [Portunus trituberculatus]